MSYKFTSDWFGGNISIWKKYLNKYINTPTNILEIGTYEGRSTIWLLENILTHPSCQIHCFDLFDGTLIDNNMTNDSSLNINYYETFLQNIKDFKDKVFIHKGYSYIELRKFNKDNFFDIVYIDGAHTSYELLMDATFSDPLLKVGGLMILDDYDLVQNNSIAEFNPKLGIDAFCCVFNQQYEKIFHDHQVILRKKNNIHIW